MGQFIDNKLTKQGLKVLLKAQIGETTLSFTKMVLGNGDIPEGTDLETITKLKSLVVTLPYLNVKVDKDNAIITAKFSERKEDGSVEEHIEVETEESTREKYKKFEFKEIGLYVENPEYSEGSEEPEEILYSYGYAGDLAETIIIGDGITLSRTIDIVTTVGNATLVEVKMESSEWVTPIDVEIAINKLEQKINERIDSIKYTKTDFYSGTNIDPIIGATPKSICEVRIENPYEGVERDIVIQAGINGRIIFKYKNGGFWVDSHDAASEIYLYVQNQQNSKGQIGFRGISYKEGSDNFITGFVSLGHNFKSSITETIELKHACVSGHKNYTESKIDNWWIRVDQIFKNDVV